jgi:hypothetical protein
MTSGASTASGFSGAWRLSTPRATSPSVGSTAKRLPVMAAVTRAALAGAMTSR